MVSDSWTFDIWCLILAVFCYYRPALLFMYWLLFCGFLDIYCHFPHMEHGPRFLWNFGSADANQGTFGKLPLPKINSHLVGVNKI